MSSSFDGRQANMDSTQVYREETFTDRKVGTIRRLTPVAADGSADGVRPVIFVGQAQVMTPMGAIPISFELEAATLNAAIEKFGPAAINRYAIPAQSKGMLACHLRSPVLSECQPLKSIAAIPTIPGKATNNATFAAAKTG